MTYYLSDTEVTLVNEKAGYINLGVMDVMPNFF